MTLPIDFTVKIQKREMGNPDGLDYPTGFWILERGKLEFLVFVNRRNKKKGDVFFGDDIIMKIDLDSYGLNPADLKEEKL